jgi:hypothetical protein
MIEFHSLIPELVYDMPIEKAKISSFEWYNKIIQDYKNNNPKPNIHTSRCPGILNICNIGWVQRSYQDFVITTNGDSKSFLWESEIDQKSLKHGELMRDYVSYHPAEHLFKFNQVKKDTLQTILKIQSPWLVKIPKGYSLLFMPIPYNDNNNFTAACGILKDSNFLNVQLFWHCLNDTIIIKKGTPLQQYVLIKDESIESVVKEANLEQFNNVESVKWYLSI